MANTSLFRREALRARSHSFLGSTVLRAPFSFAVWTSLALTLACATVLFLLLGSYTKRARVTGVTAPDAGVVKLMAPQPGVVLERRVREGQVVKAGDVLFVLSAERMTNDGKLVEGVQSAMLEQLRRRRFSLQEEQGRQSELTTQQVDSLERRLHGMRAEAMQLEREIATQRERLASGQVQLQRFEDLERQQFMSELAVQQKRDELLEQRSRLQSLERNRLSIQREVATAAAELKQVPLKGRRELAEIERSVAAIEQELAETEASRRIVVTAPHSGTVTAIVASEGQTASQQPLLTLLPEQGRLEAHLYAPSRAVGFVEPGQRVLIRFAAYPYQKFGQYEGTVAHVSRSALSESELPAQLMQLARRSDGEGLYRVTVALASNAVMAYGKPQPLTAGMQLEADILQDRRRLIEWAFEPLLSLKAKL